MPGRRWHHGHANLISRTGRQMTVRRNGIILALARAIPGAALALPARPQGPCDIYGAAGTPCVTAHSTVRALLAGYNGPLYQVKRESDGKLLDIGIVRPSARDGGGYADAAAQDRFCARSLCVINLIYDQSGKG